MSINIETAGAYISSRSDPETGKKVVQKTFKSVSEFKEEMAVWQKWQSDASEGASEGRGGDGDDVLNFTSRFIVLPIGHGEDVITPGVARAATGVQSAPSKRRAVGMRRPYLLYPYAGETLKAWLSKRSAVGSSVEDKKMALWIALQLANALRWIQCFGWVHQDLHWENVVVDGAGIARIIDIAYMVKDVDFAEGGARNRMVEDDNALVTVGEHVVYYPPEYQSKSLVKSGWDRVDVYMLGRLMEHLGAFVKNPYFDQLVDRMIVDDPMTRPLLDEQSGVIAELEKIIEYEKFSDEIRMEKRPCLRDLSLSSERVSMTGMMMGSPSPSVSKSKSNSQEQGRGSASKRRLQFSSSSSRSPSSGPAVSRRLAMD
jgi:hypothetical protein